MLTTTTPPPSNKTDTSSIIAAVLVPFFVLLLISIGLAYKRHREKGRHRNRQRNIDQENNGPIGFGTQEVIPNEQAQIEDEVNDENNAPAPVPVENNKTRNEELPPRPVDDEYVAMQLKMEKADHGDSDNYDTISSDFDAYENRKLQNLKGTLYSAGSTEPNPEDMTVNPEDWAAPHNPDDIPEIIEEFSAKR